MWPWAHAALGYLCYTLYCRYRDGTQPAGWPVVALGVGTQLPDLVDKPLAWYLHVLPYGRSLVHTALVAVPLSLLVVWLGTRRDQRAVGVAFAVGYLSHLVGDAYQAVLLREWVDLGWLLWPIATLPPGPETEGLLAHLQDIEGEPFFLVGLALTVATFGLWNWHGRPGLGELVTLVRPRGTAD